MNRTDGPAPSTSAGTPGRLATGLTAAALAASLAAPVHAALPANPTPKRVASQSAPADATPAEVHPVDPASSGVDLINLIRYTATGLNLPDTPIPADLDMTAQRTTAWRMDGTEQILLEGDVEVKIGSYGFKADRAVVLVSDHPAPGVSAHNVAIYFDNLRALGGYGVVEQKAPRLLVTAVTIGKINLNTALLRNRPDNDNAFVLESRARVQRYLDSIAAHTVALRPGGDLIPQAQFAYRDARREELLQAPALRPLPPLPMPTETPPPIFPGLMPSHPPTPPVPPVKPATPAPGGPAQEAVPLPPQSAVNFRADRVVYKQGEKESYVLLIGNAQAMYIDRKTGHRIDVSADKAVIFLKPGALGDSTQHTIPADAVHGVYLEDNGVGVVDGQYTVRGPRLFYDFASGRAVILDAVLFTWDVNQQIPIYVRAQQLRQYSFSSWGGTGVQLSTSDFAEPHFSIGAKELTVQAQHPEGGPQVLQYTAEGVTFNVQNKPVFYWPSMTGDSSEIPLKQVNVAYGSRYGATLQTRWDLFALANMKKPVGVDATLMVDGYSKRGPAVGLNADYDTDNAFGEFRSYYVHDTGIDTYLADRMNVDPGTHNRDRVLWRDSHDLGDGWESQIQLAHVSDPTFLEEWFQRESYASQEYETSLYLKQQRDDWAFTFLTRYSLMDFLPQVDLLQTRGNILSGGAPSVGYFTDKFPEVAYFREGTPLWGDRLTWFSENRASVLRLQLPGDTPLQRGFNAAQATALFGLGNNTDPYSTALLNEGLDEDTRFRGDTRQEIDAPMKFGAISFTPYVVGRLTGYDQGFAAYSGSDESIRLWGSVGARASTSFQRTYENIESDILDLHRLRHVIEPSVNAFFAGTNLHQDQLPVYDYDVESLLDGGVANFGLRNTLQTQRGGDGHWRSVDWVTLDTDFMVAQDHAIRESPLTQFFGYRPELSLAGNAFWTQLAWQASDTTSFVGDALYSFDNDRVERYDLGLTIDHSPRFSTFVMYRSITALDSDIVRYGFEYLLTPKYHVSVSQSFDINYGQNRDLTVIVTRRMPQWLLMVTVNLDTIDNDLSAGIALAPEGTGAGLLKPSNNPFLYR